MFASEPSTGTLAAGASTPISVTVNACPDPGTSTTNLSISGGGSSVSVGIVRYCGDPPAGTGLIQVTISGLPSGVQADVTMEGQGWRLWPPDTTLFADMPVGDYTWTANPVDHAGVTYTPNPTSGSFTVVEGQTTTVTIGYAP